MSADTKFRPGGALATVAVLVSLSAAAAFALQTFFAYGFARHVWGLPVEYALCVPFGLDLFVATLMAATYVLRQAKKTTAIYLWSLTFAGIALQVAAAESFAQWGHVSQPGRWAALAPAVVLAAALHTLILVRAHDPAHHDDDPAPVVRPVLSERAARRLADARGRAMAPPEKEKDQRVRLPRVPRRKAQAGSVAGDLKRMAAARVLDGDESAAEVARDLGLPGRGGARNVQNWVKAERGRRAAAPAVTSRSATSGRAGGRELQDQLHEAESAGSDAPTPKKIEDQFHGVEKGVPVNTDA